MLPNLQNFLINRFYEAETSTDKQMLMLVVHQKEVDYVTTRIKRVCPETFIIVSDAYDAYGERWNHLPEPGDLVRR